MTDKELESLLDPENHNHYYVVGPSGHSVSVPGVVFKLWQKVQASQKEEFKAYKESLRPILLSRFTKRQVHWILKDRNPYDYTLRRLWWNSINGETALQLISYNYPHAFGGYFNWTVEERIVDTIKRRMDTLKHKLTTIKEITRFTEEETDGSIEMIIEVTKDLTRLGIPVINEKTGYQLKRPSDKWDRSAYSCS